MTTSSYFDKMNSTLGSVVPLAMFVFCPNNIPQRSSKSTFGANETQMSLSISDAACLQIFLVSFREILIGQRLFQA